VIGEDLGLVPDGFRDALSNSGIYSYSVLQYEKNHEGNFKSLSDLSSQSLACFGTHDTPTVKGFASGEDISWWEKLNWIDHDNAYQVRQNRNHEVAELTQMISQSETVEDTGTQDTLGTFNSLIHRSLALSPVAMVAVQFDDIEGNVDAQNLPGTIDEHPNWRRLYKIPIGEIGVHPNLQHFSSIMADSGRESLTKKKDKTA
jgi:4-alpha-glucanotransferase